MAYDKAIHSARDIDSAHVDDKNWRYNKNFLKSFIQVLEAMSTHLPRAITSGATHYFALDESSGKVKVNPHLSTNNCLTSRYHKYEAFFIPLSAFRSLAYFVDEVPSCMEGSTRM